MPHFWLDKLKVYNYLISNIIVILLQGLSLSMSHPEESLLVPPNDFNLF